MKVLIVRRLPGLPDKDVMKGSMKGHAVPMTKLLQVLEATAPYTGDHFFHHLSRSLSQACGMRWAYVSELLIDTSRVRLVSASKDDEDLGVSEYDITGKPAAETVA